MCLMMKKVYGIVCANNPASDKCTWLEEDNDFTWSTEACVSEGKSLGRVHQQEGNTLFRKEQERGAIDE